MKQENKEIIAGIILFGISAVFFFYVFVTKQSKEIDEGFLGKYYTVNASFHDVEGINVGSKVRLAGINIGEVIDVKLSGAFKSQVNMSILKNIKLPYDSAIVVESDGLFGEKYLEILPGAEEDYISNNGYISYAQDAMRISGILERVVDYTKQKIKDCNTCMANKGGEK